MSKRILVVEDEEDNLILIVHVLKYLFGQEDVIAARDGREAMLLAYNYRPELIITDLDLPGLTGWEVARSLKSDPIFAETPILALTAWVTAEDRNRALDAGCEWYIEKPLNLDVFINVMREYVEPTSRSFTTVAL